MMKPVEIAKILVCSLLASAFLGACAKPPGRPIKAGLKDPDQKAGQLSFSVCSTKALSLLEARQNVLFKIHEIIKNVDVVELTDAQKRELKKTAIDLDPATKAVIDELKVIKGQNPKLAEGCEQTDDKTTPPKKYQHLAEKILESDRNLKVKIEKLTKGIAIEIPGDGTPSDNDGKMSPPPKKYAEKEVFEVGKTYRFADELAEKIIELEGEQVLVVSFGTVSTSTKELFYKRIENFVKPYGDMGLCWLESRNDEIKDLKRHQLLKLALNESKLLNLNEKVSVYKSRLVFSNSELGLYSWLCQYPPRKDQEQEEVLRQLFSSQIGTIEKK